MSNTRTKAAAKVHVFFTRGAEFGFDLYTTNRTSGSKVQLDLQTQTPQIDSDQLPKHWGMLGSTKRGGEFQQHQTYWQSTSRSKNSPKMNWWRHPVSGLQQPFFSQMNIDMWRPPLTSLSDFNAWCSQKTHPGTVICAAESSGVDRGSFNRRSSSAKTFKRPGMWVMCGNAWYRRMNLKYGVNTAARTGVIVRPFAEAASAALLSVACWHAIGPRVRGRWASMQKDNVNWARSSHVAMCFCMSSPSPGHSICASSSDIRNWNQIDEPSGKMAAPTCHRGRGHSVRRCLDLNPCRSTHRQGKWRRNQELQAWSVSDASSSSFRCGDVGSRIPNQTRRDLTCNDLTSAIVFTWELATGHSVTPGRSDWCLWVNCKCSSSWVIMAWKVVWSMPTIVVGMRCNALYSGISSGRR